MQSVDNAPVTESLGRLGCAFRTGAIPESSRYSFLPSSWMTVLSSTLVKASSFTVGVAGDDVGKTASGVLRRSHQTSWTVETSVGVEVDCRENSLPDGIL